MIKLLVIVLFTLSQSAHAAFWSLEVRDVESSEVKTYKFSEVKMHKLEMPKLSSMFCTLQVFTPEELGSTPETKITVQKVELLCASETGGVITRKACKSVPDEYEKSVATVVQVVEDQVKTKKPKGKKGFKSYLMTLYCQ